MDALRPRSRPASRGGRRRRSRARARRPRSKPSSRSIRSSIVSSAGCRGGVEILVEAEREPRVGGARDRRSEVEVVASVERQLRPLERALDRGARDLAVALRAVAVARGEQRAVDRDREVERRAGDEQLAVDVPAPAARRAVEWTPGSGGGMPITPRNGATARPSSPRARPVARSAVAKRPSRTVVPPPNVTPQRAGVVTSSIATTSVCPARAPRTSIGPFSAWPVELRIARVEVLALGLPAPAGVERPERNGLAGIDGQHRREVAREVPVQRRPLERQLVDHAQNSRSLRDRRRGRAPPTACTRPRSSSTGTGRRIRSRGAPARAGRGSPSRRGSPRARRRSRRCAAPPAR